MPFTNDLYKIFNEHSSIFEKYFALKFKELPLKKSFQEEINVDKLHEIIQSEYKNENLIIKHDDLYKTKFKSKEWKKINQNYFCEIKTGLIVFYENEELSILYNNKINIEEINTLTELFKDAIESDINKHNFLMVKKSKYDGYELSPFSIKNQDIQLNDNYNDDLISIHPQIIQHLNSKDKHGVFLFHGLPGAGKTTYIRNLISECNIRFIYLPNNLFNHISDPEFIAFLSEYPDSVIILEDCEELLKSRKHNENINGISSILNLADGLLGDALKLKIICTFNLELNKIDEALLRKGRLAYRYEFKELETNKANNLAKKINVNHIITKPTTIAEIYNFHQNNNNNEESKNKIGFK